jgi:hypothetical protein
VFSGPCFAKKGTEGVIICKLGFFRGHLSVWLNSVFKAEEFPASIAYLDATLTNVDGNDFSHGLF